jgi:hypothetical protein
MNTVSTINCKISESISSENSDCELDMIVEDKAMVTALMWHRSPLQQPLKPQGRPPSPKEARKLGLC